MAAADVPEESDEEETLHANIETGDAISSEASQSQSESEKIEEEIGEEVGGEPQVKKAGPQATTLPRRRR